MQHHAGWVGSIPVADEIHQLQHSSSTAPAALLLTCSRRQPQSNTSRVGAPVLVLPRARDGNHRATPAGLEHRCWQDGPQCCAALLSLHQWRKSPIDCSLEGAAACMDQRIPVTVHRVLGISNRGRDVLYGLDDESIVSVLDKHGVDGPPSIATLEKSIKLMNSADEHFLRTLIMLVLSSFLCPTSSLKISPSAFLRW
ncbi:hypothetical protein D1007_42246 [Hordeum vulgare]|nr:hypothetical protein D1007_42246 [Hordeum vulgare]